MSDNNKLDNQVHSAITIAFRLSFIAILLIASFNIMAPFLMPIIWGIIFSIGVFPLFSSLSKMLGNRNNMASTIIVLIGISILVVPFGIIINSTADSIDVFVTQLNEGTFKLPVPPIEVADWPLIGERLYELWVRSTNNLEVLIDKLQPYLSTVLPTIFSSAAGVVGTVFQFIFSIIIAGLLLVNADGGKKVANALFQTIVGEQGKDFVKLSKGTIKGVVQGILGTAVIQTGFLSLGLFVVGTPGAGIWSVLILFICIIQIPPIVVVLPIVIYTFNVESTTTAIIFTVWSLVWAASDNIIKPILMGRGVDVPMLVILLGSIGGMVAFGIIGLFVGSVVLAITYKVIIEISNKQASYNQE